MLSGLGIAHRRGGYRDPESQAFIESWFGKLKEREVWRSEYETLKDARAGVGAYVERYHDRPHSSLDYRTPKEVRQPGRMPRTRSKPYEKKRPEVSTGVGSRSPYIWHKTADEILDSLANYCQRISDSGH